MINAASRATQPDYLKAYSLTCEPFADTLDGRFFYGASPLMQRVDLLTHLTQFGESVVLVSGPHGSGKTTLLGRFVGQTGKHWRLCLINAEEFGQFRQRLGDALGTSDGGDEQQMLARWAADSDASQLLVIVIDDAQQLPADALQKLCALLDQPLADRVRLIMFGTPEAQSALKQALELNNLPCKAQLLEIPKLSVEDTAAYLMYRLAVAGYSGESPFTPTEVRAICKAADGRPAGINRLAHAALVEHRMRSRSQGQRAHRKPRPLVGGALGLAGLLVIAVAVYLGWEHERPTQSMDFATDRGKGGDREEVPLNLPEPEPVPAPDGPSSATIATVIRPDLPAPAPAPGARLETAPPVPTGKSPNTPVVQPPAPPEAEERLHAEPARELQPPAPAAVEAVPPAAQPLNDAAPPTATEPVAVAPAVTAAELQESVRTPAKAPKATSAGPHRESWLLQQPPGNYSLQLLGTRNQPAIIDYIRRNKLSPEQTAYYRGSFKGGEWYVLMYGNFLSRQAALEARADLPVKVRKEKPWPRSLESVHTAIREAQ